MAKATPLEKIYDVFYQKIQKNLTKHPEYDVNVVNNLVDAFLATSFYEYEENLGITLTIGNSVVDNVVVKVINEDIPNSHINLLGKLMYKAYLNKDLEEALQLANEFNKRSELKVLGLPTKVSTLNKRIDKLDAEINKSFTRNSFKGLGD